MRRRLSQEEQQEYIKAEIKEYTEMKKQAFRDQKRKESIDKYMKNRRNSFSQNSNNNSQTQIDNNRQNQGEQEQLQSDQESRIIKKQEEIMNRYLHIQKLGWIKITCKNNKLVQVIFQDQNEQHDVIQPEGSLVNEVYSQLQKYFNKELKEFTIKPEQYDLQKATDFQKKVWLEICKIPYGKSVTYSEIAERINQPNAFRAVANACGQNNFLILFPCHRVLAQNKQLSGYLGGTYRKEKLLELEDIIYYKG
ncbi:Methylated-DNA-[protein]-cysteine S-methyltransferase, DNA binding [Pseudocohnilembus persalinus]|uniref:Methylated-DNA--protein-cysteine methyltransferase n=1 Tax=Pseudocohnilembus persalinus TaxID=266149 RepID=A0A0V0QS78_PSEPJ|nr:Methylated-DNA-[protein]-cysteine S-methyltransferase, DNA binding [Pseudocohnilembus persalinus]|eukprot:KRX05166.1 Methylated-DNA-[protein]-cysteine S-methyltransferase, DNA binding [Pseudocohnilembus persalinus]